MSYRAIFSSLAPLLIASAGACASVKAPAESISRAHEARKPVASASSEARSVESVETAPDKEDPCARRRPGPKPGARVRQSSSVAIVYQGTRTLAYAADADRSALFTVDVDSRVVLAKTPLEGAPSQMLVLGDGRVAVALRDRNRVVVLSPGDKPEDPLEPLCSAVVPTEPFALATDVDEATLFVTSGWGRALTALDSSSLAERFSVRLPREPRAVLVEPSGARAFVSHAVGDGLSIVKLSHESSTAHAIDVRVGEDQDGKPRRAGQGFSLVAVSRPNPDGSERWTRVLSPIVTVDQASTSASTVTYGARTLAASPLVAVIDASAETLLTKKLRERQFMNTSTACTLPRAAAMAPSDRLLVACLGIDDVIELDTRSRDPMEFELRRFHVPAGPTGIAVDVSHERSVVWSQFAASLSVLPLGKDDAAPRFSITVAEGLPPGLNAAEARGRILFHSTNDPRISTDGRACASCHIDGREDGITWTTPEGHHQTIMLAGRAKDGPFGWRGDTRSLYSHVSRTMKRLNGRGVFGPEDKTDVESLVAYLSVMPAPVRDEMNEPRKKLAARGRDIFNDPSVGCATCHPGGGSDHAAWDVAKSPFRIPFDTPSLRFVSGTAPYFHDGRYATLGELLRQSGGSMGHTEKLSDEDLGALEAYLEEL